MAVNVPQMVEAAKRFTKNLMFDKALAALKYVYAECPEAAYVDIRKLRNEIVRSMRSGAATQADKDTLKESYKLTAKDVLDDYFIYLEWNRPVQSRFYAPRRKQLYPVVKQMQRLERGEIDILCISLPPGVGKTTVAEFFLSHFAGNNPDKANVISSHNASFLHGMYEESLRILDEKGEYLFNDVFDLKVARTNAQDMKIDVGKARRFSTYQFSSVGAGNAGKIRAQGLLYCDDLIEGIEEALSKERLDKKWQAYNTDLRQRKEGNCRELHIATRWSCHDVIGRLEEQYGGSDRAVFITVPALDDNGESNFNYGGDIGFTTAFYNDIKSTMDAASWAALYMNQPIEREGLLYEREALRRYYSLPDGEPDAIVGVCDTAEGGGDDTVLPVFAVYGNDHYMIDCVCSDALPEVTDGLCAEVLVRNKVHSCQFESNAAGGRTADKVDEMVKARQSAGRKTHITKHRTTQNKATKIIVNSTFVKEHCLFLDDSKIQNGSAYASFMRKMCSYSVKGKNKHDDVVDALAQYAMYVESTTVGTVTLVKRPF